MLLDDPDNEVKIKKKTPISFPILDDYLHYLSLSLARSLSFSLARSLSLSLSCYVCVSLSLFVCLLIVLSCLSLSLSLCLCLCLCLKTVLSSL
jgi:hypothetical protein